MIRRMFFVSVLSSMILVVQPAAAEPLGAPSGKVVLTVSGEIGQINALGGVEFDIEMLKKFPARDIITTTYWHDGVQHFKGVSAVVVLESLGVKEGVLTATAEDDYTVDIPLAELGAYDPIFALEWNGTNLAEDAAGPIWLIFPYDKMTAEERERYTAWSVWSLQQIKIRK